MTQAIPRSDQSNAPLTHRGSTRNCNDAVFTPAVQTQTLSCTMQSLYASSGYKDELAWAAAWLYKVTRETGYLKAARTYYSQVGGTP